MQDTATNIISTADVDDCNGRLFLIHQLGERLGCDFEEILGDRYFGNGYALHGAGVQVFKLLKLKVGSCSLVVVVMKPGTRELCKTVLSTHFFQTG